MDGMEKPVKALVGSVGLQALDRNEDLLGRASAWTRRGCQTPPEENAVPGSCIDAPGIDRAAIHRTVGVGVQKVFDTALGVTRK